MSKARRKITLTEPPAEIIRGAQLKAEYLTQEVPQFRDNPLIEAIPPALTPREVTEYLLQLPPYSASDREMDLVYRLQMTETAREFFVPNGKHLTVYYAVTNMIRRGYVRRNPVMWEYWKRMHQNIESFLKAIKESPLPNSRARGLALVGSGGTGKSTTMEKVLQSLPQVITHVSYKSQIFIMKQLVWLKLDCPRDGSLRELCVHFFFAVDEILGTEYAKRYTGNSHRTLEDMIAGMARVAANQCLGLLVIDEIQDLSEARGGGDITMVNFFVRLENAIGVPFALIGTQDAIPILSAQFRQARRVSEQGYIVWDRMSEVEPPASEFDDEEEDGADEAGDATPTRNLPPESPTSKGGENEQQTAPRPDPVWKNFIETLWSYQYIKNPEPLKENVIEDKRAHALYVASKGIPAVAQTVFVLTQQLAILTEEERLTPGLIKETFRSHQQVIGELLGESRMKKPRQIKPVGDLADLDRVYEAEYFPVISPDGATGDEPMEGRDLEVAPDESASSEGLPNYGKSAAKAQVKSGLAASAPKRGKSDEKLRRGRNGTKKDDPRKRSTSSGERASGRDSRKKDKATKYRRSPDEYL